MKNIIKSIMSKLVATVFVWCGNGIKPSNEVFNSIRINALIQQLRKNGCLDEGVYENDIEKQIYNILGGSNDGGKRIR